MIFPYRSYEVIPTPGQRTGVIHRPVIPVRVHGAAGTQVILGLVDTGADVTILPAFVLPLIGAEDIYAPEAHFRGLGNQTVTVRYRRVELSLDDADGPCRWHADIGFLDGRDVAILGHAGFLEHFQATFDSARHRLTLGPNSDYPGSPAP